MSFNCKDSSFNHGDMSFNHKGMSYARFAQGESMWQESSNGNLACTLQGEHLARARTTSELRQSFWAKKQEAPSKHPTPDACQQRPTPDTPS